MVHRSSTWRPAFFAAGLLIGIAGVSSPVRAVDDGYQNVFSSVLGAVGLMPPDRSPEIEYRERAPLVLPPRQALGKPQEPGALRTAAWPQDPDVIARRKAEEEADSPMLSVFDKRIDRPESKAEALKHRAAQTDNATPDYCRGSQHADAACRLMPAEMQRQEALYRAENPTRTTTVVTAGVEPEREYLTQPPKGYLKPTKTVRATAEAPQPERNDAAPLSALIQRPSTEPEESPNQ